MLNREPDYYAIMNLLAIETATEACSAALSVDGTIFSRFQVQPQGHSRLILPMVEALLLEAGINKDEVQGIAFGRGPGSFTGVRIAAAVAQGLAFARDLPVYPVSTLAALAQQAARRGESAILAAIDARMREVYWGAYNVDDGGLVHLIGTEMVCAPVQVSPPRKAHWFGIGSGWEAYPSELAQGLSVGLAGVDSAALPAAEDILRLAAAVAPVRADRALPVYLRDRVAEKPKSPTAAVRSR